MLHWDAREQVYLDKFLPRAEEIQEDSGKDNILEMLDYGTRTTGFSPKDVN